MNAEDLFKKWDADGNGLISKDELEGDGVLRNHAMLTTTPKGAGYSLESQQLKCAGN